MKLASLVLIATLTGCTAGFRVDHAPAGTGLDATVQGPGETVVLRDKDGTALAGASLTINPVALITNLIEYASTLMAGGKKAAPAQ